MNQRISEQAFYQYLKCPSWLSYQYTTGEDIREPLMRKLQDEGLIRERELALLGERPYEEVNLDDVDEAAARTVELMKAGTQTIYRAALTHGRFVGRPDILERVEGQSDLGDWYYVACDIKRSRHLKDEYRFQGAFYADMLEKVQGVRPVQGYVLHADGDVEGYLIDDAHTDYRLTLDEIERIYDGEKPEPFLTSASKQSPWFEEYLQEVKECDHLSLVNRIWRSEVDALKGVGINTVTELAEADEKQLAKVPGVTKERTMFLHKQAQAMSQNKVVRIAPTDLPPENGPVLVIDIESDPLRDVHYLIGVLVVDGETEEYIPILANTPEEEGKMWQEFLLLLEKYPDARMYHYGWYEQDVFRRMGEKYGVPERIAKQFEERMVDVIVRMRESVIFPIPFYSLKDTSKYLGFAWRHQVTGLDSVLWYHDWMDDGDEEALKKILEYNEDDVRATWFLRNWCVGDE